MADEKPNTNQGADQCIAPKWINADLIQRALKKGGEDNLHVKELTVRLGAAAGDNYGSTIYRVTAILSDGSTGSFMVKDPAAGETRAEVTREPGKFRREVYMLTDVLPQIEALLEEAAPGKFPPLAARCPLYGTDPRQFVVLEDLAPQGFQLADRKRGLGLRHTLLALRALARYHAASHVLLQRRPEIAEKLPNSWDYTEEDLRSFLESRVQAAVNAVESWPGFEELASLLEKSKPLTVNKAVKLLDLKPGAFNVILQGDFWVNNMMFRYTDEDPTDHRMMDFQGSVVCSPTIDLLYFISTSVSEEVSTHHEDLLVREYHHELNETLALLGAEGPSLAVLVDDINAHGVQALVGALNVLPIVRAQRAVNAGAAADGDASPISLLYEDPAVKKWMQRVLPEYKRRGWLPC